MTGNEQLVWSGFWAGIKMELHAVGVAAAEHPLLFTVIGAVIVLGLVVRALDSRRRRAR